ncbi:hypothetical protein GCM10010289_66820 [Streptomyces violascens]|uniref:Uncharacterized protein n=1 Tax=Streptomyces violascens TaxID=67381 RepID=A0ABQ3QLN3_9ACTN|nr:hypothetical protein GCM10010289_66820 [Streptomyces violascens]GHI38181.1 hypothetical protein Sviol_25890 [Streptomyces violascens]
MARRFEAHGLFEHRAPDLVTDIGELRRLDDLHDGHLTGVFRGVPRDLGRPGAGRPGVGFHRNAVGLGGPEEWGLWGCVELGMRVRAVEGEIFPTPPLPAAALCL